LSLPLQLVFPGSSLDGNGKEKSDFCSVSFDFLNLLVSTIFEIAGTAHFESSLIIDGATVKVSHFIMTIKTFVIMKNNVFSNNA